MAIYMYIELVLSFLLLYDGRNVYGYNIRRNLCLDTPLKFAMGNESCDFTSSTANSFLSAGQTTCLHTCEVTLSDIYRYQRHFGIKTLQLKFHDGTYSINICREFYDYDFYRWLNDHFVYVKTLAVDCTKWNFDKVLVGGGCYLDTQCIGTMNSVGCENRICVCKRGYISINRYCYAADVPMGQPCVYDMQCTRSPFSGVCMNHTCAACPAGYINYYNTCYPDKVLVGGACDLYEQCTGTEHSGVCKYSRCTCKEGYMSIEGDCYRADVPLNETCTYDMQCIRSPFSGVCVNHTCACQDGYIKHNNTCYPDKVLVGGACDLYEQCTGTEHSGVCKDRRCTCKEGYMSIGGGCYRGNLSLNESCEVNEQCSASPYAVCRNTTCTCEEGYTVVDTTSCVYQIVPARSFEQPQADGNGPGSIVGALIGGLLGGVLITTLIVYIISRRSSTNVKKREEPVAMFVANNSCGSNINIERGSNNGSKDEIKPRKVVNVHPYARSADSPTYSNVRDVTEQPTNEDVYNHLHEKEKLDCDDDYDHTTGVTGHVTEYNDYSHLHSGRGNMRLNLSVDDEYANTVPEDTSTDDYFTLEQQ